MDMHRCIYMYITQMYIYILVNHTLCIIHTLIHTYLHTYIHPYIHVKIRTYILKYIFAYTYAPVTYQPTFHSHIHTYTVVLPTEGPSYLHRYRQTDRQTN